jgi:Circularly permutated YpsA SLOG family
LDAALDLGFSCGGWCPGGRLAEDGKIPDRYPVIELADGRYAERTAQNVADSDGTLIIAHGPLIGGTRETLQFCVEQGKPHFVIDLHTAAIDEATAQALEFVRTLSSRANARDLPFLRPGMTIVLNVAGPRASQWPQARDVAHEILSAMLRQLSGHSRADEYSA